MHPCTDSDQISGKDTKTISCDEEFSNVNISKIPTLKPSFKKDGVVTAANASTLNDGASAMLLMSRAKAASLGLKPLALIRSYADAEHDPSSGDALDQDASEFPTGHLDVVRLADASLHGRLDFADGLGEGHAAGQ